MNDVLNAAQDIGEALSAFSAVVPELGMFGAAFEFIGAFGDQGPSDTELILNAIQ